MSPAADASPHDLSRAGAVKRQVWKLRWGAAGLVLLMLGLGALVMVTEPTSVARAFGSATEVTAVVDTVALSEDQPIKRRKRSGPSWSLTLHWVDQAGGAASGDVRLRSKVQPYDPGDPVSIFVTDGSSDVSLGTHNDGSAIWVLIGTIIGSFGAAWWMVWYSRRWKRLTAVPDERPPKRLRVTEVRDLRKSVAVALDYRPVTGVRFPGSIRLHRQPPFVHPVVDEELDVWPFREDGGGPLLVRQDNGTWWAASGSLH